MATHDLPISPLMFSAIRTGAWNEIVAPRGGEDYQIGGILCFREWSENHYTDSPPIVYRITSVATHYADMTRIPHGFFLVAFEPIPPVHNAPVHEFIPVAKVARNAIPATPRKQSRWPY